MGGEPGTFGTTLNCEHCCTARSYCLAGLVGGSGRRVALNLSAKIVEPIVSFRRCPIILSWKREVRRESKNTGMKRFLTATRRFAAKLVRPALVLSVALLVVWGLFYLGFALLLHAAHESLQSHPDPAPDYAESVTRFQRLHKVE